MIRAMLVGMSTKSAISSPNEIVVNTTFHLEVPVLPAEATSDEYKQHLQTCINTEIDQKVALTGEWAGKPMSLYGRNSASGTYGYFKENALAFNLDVDVGVLLAEAFGPEGHQIVEGVGADAVQVAGNPFGLCVPFQARVDADVFSQRRGRAHGDQSGRGHQPFLAKYFFHADLLVFSIVPLGGIVSDSIHVGLSIGRKC